MSHFLFPDFLEDPEQYRLAEELWLKNWGELLQDVGQVHRWKAPFTRQLLMTGDPVGMATRIFQRR